MDTIANCICVLRTWCVANGDSLNGLIMYDLPLPVQEKKLFWRVLIINMNISYNHDRTRNEEANDSVSDLQPIFVK